MKAQGIIFDMDGTLYQFGRGQEANSFVESQFGQTIRSNVRQFFESHFSLSPADAAAMLADLDTRFAGEVSLGLEKEFGVPRIDYFAKTWDLDPDMFLDQNQNLREALGTITVPKAVLSAAPGIWVGRVLDHLGITSLFSPAIFNGEPDLRKPDPQVFQQVADFLGSPPDRIVSVGDQEHSDILPAKAIGMMTLKIGTDSQTQADFIAPNAIEAIALLRSENIL